MHREISCCRLCRSSHLELSLELGEQCLTGVFPRQGQKHPERGPLTLLRCLGCGLVQLRHSYDPAEMYGENYGYRSGLNRSMVEHLRARVESLRKVVTLRPNDIVVDIGSNDGTTLGFYPAHEMQLVGFDPSAAQFRQYYRGDIRVVTEFFSADRFRAERGPNAKARLVTSIAMFYDLEDPLAFAEGVASILADDGVWHFEQSYLPLMLKTNAYDTVCHEHLEYYAVRQIHWLAERAGLKIIDLSTNDVNGGSFAITVAKPSAPYPACDTLTNEYLRNETALGLERAATYAAFRDRVLRHRDELLDMLSRINDRGQVVCGYGASTKGNVILQFCGLDARLIPCIAEVNERKFGCVTPGSNIPIVPEADVRARKPDYLLVLPWHFKSNLVQREADYLKRGGTMLFPLPVIEEITG